MVYWNSSHVHRDWRAAQKKRSPWEYLFWCSSQISGRIIFKSSSPYKEFFSGFNQKQCFVVPLLNNFSPERQVWLLLCAGGISVLLSQNQNMCNITAPCSSVSSSSSGGFTAQFLAAAAGIENFSLFIFPIALQLFGAMGVQNSGWGTCTQSSHMLQSKRNLEWIGDLRGHSFFFVYIFFPPLCALYNKILPGEQEAWRVNWLRWKLDCNNGDFVFLQPYLDRVVSEY